MENKTKYVHDYSKPSKVDKILLEAFSVLASSKSCDVTAARELIGSARQLLDEYLAGDNLVPDDDDVDFESSYSFISIAGESSDDLPF